MYIMPLDATIRASFQQKQEIESLLWRKPFCFKDPRFSYTYPAWRPYLVNAVPIVVFRHPAEVCVSVLRFFDTRRVSYSPSYVFRLWLRIYEHIMNNVEVAEDWLFVDYEDLLHGIALPDIEGRLETRLDRQMIDLRLSRSKDLAAKFEVPEACLQMYERLKNLAEIGYGF
jgi:hypothetical protein